MRRWFTTTRQDVPARAVAIHGSWWSRPIATLAGELDANVHRGLDSSAVAARRAQYGDNAFEPEHRAAWIRMLGTQLRSPLVVLLVVAATVSALAREWTDAIVVIAIVLSSALLGTYHEWRAGAAVEKLQARVSVRTSVLRDGVFKSIPIVEIVPGDVIRLTAGSLVPGDAALISATNLFVTEAALTGESFPVEKEVGASTEAASIGERRGAVFLGTSVQSGTGTALVMTTGRTTELGKIAHRLAARAPESAFERGIRHFGMLILRVMGLLTIVVLGAHILLGRPAIDALLFALALAVGISPEMLPAILAITLSRGAVRMAERGVIVKRLAAIEGLGAMDVLCTDKTGTLTEGVVRLDGALDTTGTRSDRVLTLARVNAELQSGLPNALDGAIVSAADKAGLMLDGAVKCDEIPYDFPASA